MIVWLAAVVVLALGGALLALGLRGKRVNDHPICRKCGFDLVGVYAPQSAPTPSEVAQLSELCVERQRTESAEPIRTAPVGSASEFTDGINPDVHTTHSSESCATTSRCPECGRDLNAMRAVRIGARRKRPLVLAGGVLLLLLAASLTGAWGWGRASSFNWNTIKPTWWLVLETDSPELAIAGAALEELVARAARDDLTRSTHENLVDRALRLQADPNATWHTGWGDLVEIAMSRGWLSNEQTLMYVKGTPAIGARVRSPVMHGGATSLDFSFSPHRAGSGTHRSFEILVEPQEVILNGKRIEHAAGFASYFPGPGRSGWNTPDVLSTMTPGENHVEVIIQMRMRRDSELAMRGSGIAVGGDPLVVKESDSEPWTDRLSTTFTVLEPGQSDVTLIDAPDLKEAIRQSVRIDRAVITRSDDGDTASVSVMINQPPMEVAFDIIARVGDVEIPLGVCQGQPNASMGMGGSATKVDIDLAGAQLIFRASADAARRSRAIREIWNGEIVIDDVQWTIDEPWDAEPTPP